MSYLIYVAGFGTAVVFFLWLRDARIFLRTGLPGYRKAAYHGVLYAALAQIGFFITSSTVIELAGLGVILLALYLQGKLEREKIWTGKEPALERFLGSAKPPRQKTDKGTGKI
ncbi:MAG: ABC transporter permease [Methanoregulaceae archaeon]